MDLQKDLPPAGSSPKVHEAKTEGPSTRALNEFTKRWTKTFGEGTIEIPSVKPYEVVSTGSLTLDQALGCGGTVVGRITELWGEGGTGKTTMALISAANYQKAYPHRLIGWIDVERSWDSSWARDHNVILDKVRKVKPLSAQDVADQVQTMVGSGLFSMVVIDSIGGMIGRAEMEKDADEVTVAEVAKVVTRMVKRQAAMCDINHTALWILNQPRDRIGGGPRSGMTTGGGNALKMVTTAKIRLKRTATTPYLLTSKPTDGQAGHEVAAVVERNKIAPPWKVATFGLFNQSTTRYGPMGIDRSSEAFTMGVRYDIIGNPAAGSYQLPDREGITRGKDKVLQALRESPDLVEQIRGQLLTKIASDVQETLPVIDDDEFMTGGIDE